MEQVRNITVIPARKKAARRLPKGQLDKRKMINTAVGTAAG